MVGLDPRLRAKHIRGQTTPKIRITKSEVRKQRTDLQEFWGQPKHPEDLQKLDSLLNKFRQYQAPPPSAVLIQVVETMSELTPNLMRHIKAYPEALDSLSWEVTEQLIAEFFASWGYDVSLVGHDPRTGADIFATKLLNPEGVTIRLFIEVKQWKKKVGVEVLDQVFGAMFRERKNLGCHAAMIVSRAGFKDFKRDNYRDLELMGIELRDRQDLLRWLEDYQPTGDGLWLWEKTVSELN